MFNRRFRRNLLGLAVAVGATSVTTLAEVVITHYAAIPNISLLYLPVILVTAVYFGIWPSLAAATLAVLQYDFFLLNPIFTFTISQAQDVLAFVIFVIVAVLTGELAAGARARAEAAQRRAAESETLYELGQALMSSYQLPDVLDAITRRVVEVFDASRCAIFVPDADGALGLAAETVRQRGERNRADHAAVSWVYEQGTEVGVPVSRARDRQQVYVPLRTANRTVGVMEVGAKRSGEPLDTAERRLVTSFAAQAALVIERAASEEERQKLRVLEESDRLKSALLSAVSHDLRTPLASIKASATALLLADAAWTADEGREFIATIDHEADRLNRLVGNLLDLSRLEAGALHPVLEWYDVREVVDTVRPHLMSLLDGRPFSLELEPNLPAVQLDLVRTEELLINLVENALKYTPPGSPLEITITRDGDALVLAVIDHGPGIPARQRERIFDSFYRLGKHSDRDPGTGLGLAICRGIAEAHGGSLAIRDTPGGGATFVVTLPLAREEAAV